MSKVKSTTVIAPTDVHRGYASGANFAKSLVAGKSNKSEKSSKKAKIKIMKPPIGGWNATNSETKK